MQGHLHNIIYQVCFKTAWKICICKQGLSVMTLVKKANIIINDHKEKMLRNSNEGPVLST